MNRPAPFRHEGTILLLLLGAGLASRALFLSTSPHMWDSASYLDQARRILHGEVWHRPPLDLNHPLYVLAVAGAAWIAAPFRGGILDPEGPARAVSVLASVLGIFPLHALARRLQVGAPARLWCAGLFLAVPLVWWYGVEIMSDGPGAFLLLCVAALSARAAARPGIGIAVASGLVLGAAFLVRFGSLALLPLAVLAPLASGPRRGTRALGVLLGALLLPALYYGLLADRVQPVPPVPPVPLLSAVNARTIATSAGWLAGRLAGLSRHLENGAPWPLLLAALAGLVLLARGTFRREAGSRGRLLFLVGCVAPYATVLLLAPPRASRLLLPLMPAIALLAARALGALPRRLLPWAGAALVAALALRAVPVLRLLHTRESYLQAHALWFAEHVPPGSLVLSSEAESHVNYYAPGCATAHLAPRPGSWVAGGTGWDAALRRIEEAHREGKRVFASNETGVEAFREDLEARFRFLERGRIPAARLRDRGDHGFVCMEAELMARSEDAVFWEILPGPGPRRLALEVMEPVRRGGTLELRVSGPAHAGLAFAAGLSFGTAPGIAVGHRRIPLAPDPLLRATVEEPAIAACLRGVLDPSGHGVAKVPVPADLPFFRCHAVVVTIEEWKLRGISDPVTILIE